MEVKKVRILLEDFISRKSGTYGKFTANTINVNVFITQEVKDMGMFMDMPYEKYDANLPFLTYEPIPEKLNLYGSPDFNFITNPGSNFKTNGDNQDTRYIYKNLENYYKPGVIVSGITEERLDDFSAYGRDGLDRFIPGFELNKETFENYLGNTVDGVSKILSINDYNPMIYTELADDNDPNIGTILQSDGILFKTYTGVTNVNSLIISKRVNVNDLTTISYNGQGINETNSTLSALTIQEYLLHITQKPKVVSDVFIDRGGQTVFQNHLQLGEIVTLDDLINYGNGYYNII